MPSVGCFERKRKQRVEQVVVPAVAIFNSVSPAMLRAVPFRLTFCLYECRSGIVPNAQLRAKLGCPPLGRYSVEQRHSGTTVRSIPTPFVARSRVLRLSVPPLNVPVFWQQRETLVRRGCWSKR